MIAKDLIPEVGAKPFVIMNGLLKRLCAEVTSVSAGSSDPRPGRLPGRSHYRGPLPPGSRG